MKTTKTFFWIVLTMMIFNGHLSAKLYKWVDENGKVHYSDKVPPEQIDKARQELNQTGVVKETIERALTPEEREARAEELKKQRLAAKEKREKEQQIEDERNKLLKSYSSADQITRLKHERIAALKRNIELANENLIIQKRNLDDLLKRAADQERSGGVVSDAFTAQIEKSREQIVHQHEFIEDKQLEISETKVKYNNELAKYLFYTGQTKTIIPISESDEDNQSEQVEQVEQAEQANDSQ